MTDSNTGKVPKEALNYLQQKKLTPGFSFQDVWRDEHNSSFTVAKMMQLDLLADTKQAMLDAIEQGQTFKQFADNLKPTLVKKGWWGKQMMKDPLDESDKLVQLGSDARLKTIFDTNMRTAMTAGQWERVERNKETHPYLLYELGASREHRVEHQAWAGLCLPVDDDFWKTHLPQNGWGCNCRVRSVSAAELEKLTESGVSAREQELDEHSGLPTGRFTEKRSAIQTGSPVIKTREVKNKRTGEVSQVPIGIDPGWDYNAGSRLAQLADNAMVKAIDAEPMLAAISITDLMQVKAISAEVGKVFAQGVEDAVKQIAIGKAIPRGTTWHVGALSPDVVNALKKENVLLNSAVVSIQDSDLLHMLRTQKTKGRSTDRRLPVEFLQQLPQHLLTPKAIVRDLQQKTPTLLYLYQLETAGKKVTVKLNYEIKVNKEKVKTK
ncbi:MAG: phage minor head protein [Psychromonas sp.]